MGPQNGILTRAVFSARYRPMFAANRPRRLADRTTGARPFGAIVPFRGREFVCHGLHPRSRPLFLGQQAAIIH